MNGDVPRGPLSHITVLDLTQFLAGPSASQTLGDLGARVIKVEPPEGDITRKMPPHFFKGESAYYLSANRNKESIVLNLKDPRAHEIFLQLVATVDIVLESFRPGVAAKLGLDYERLKAVNPRLVMCSLSGFGQDGPYNHRPAYDIIVQGLSGGMSMTGIDQPVRTGVPLGDLAAGMYAVIGVLAGLARANATGEGSYVDIGMLDCQISMLSYQAAYYLLSGEVPGLQGNGHRSLPTYRAYRCAGGVQIVVTANTEEMWRSLCEVVGLPELPADPRFVDRASRLRNRAALDGLLEPAFERRDAAEVLVALEKAGVPVAPINRVDQALADPHVAHREMVLELHDDEGETLRVVGNPIKVAGYPTDRHRFPPHLGSDGERVLSERLGMSREEIAALVAHGVVGDGRAQPV